MVVPHALVYDAIDPVTLRNQTGMSMAERAWAHSLKFDVDFTKEQLRTIYKLNRISFRRITSRVGRTNLDDVHTQADELRNL